MRRVLTKLIFIDGLGILNKGLALYHRDVISSLYCSLGGGFKVVVKHWQHLTGNDDDTGQRRQNPVILLGVLP